MGGERREGEIAQTRNRKEGEMGLKFPWVVFGAVPLFINIFFLVGKFRFSLLLTRSDVFTAGIRGLSLDNVTHDVLDDLEVFR